MDPHIQKRSFDNGLTLFYDETPWSESFAFAIGVQVGSRHDALNQSGLASLTCEMTNRGAGDYGNRSFYEALLDLGVSSGETATKSRTNFGARGVCDMWEKTLELIALQILHPRFDEDEFDECRMTQLQEIVALEDEPRARGKKEILRISVPFPWNRSSLGERSSLAELTIDDVRQFYNRHYRANGTVIAVAGKMGWERLQDKVFQLFGDWESRDVDSPNEIPSEGSLSHIESDTAQTHIFLSAEEVPFGHDDYWRAVTGYGVLSGGVSSRLFTEVREKRGLCYTVGADVSTIGPYGRLQCYCGTKRESAQEALEIIIREIDRLRVEPVSKSELDFVKISTRTSLVTQGESTASRVRGILHDWFNLKTVRSLDEKLALYERLTVDDLYDYFSSRPPLKFKMVTLGADALQLPKERTL